MAWPLVDGMTEGGRGRLEREVRRKLGRNFAYFTVLPEAGPADWSPQKGKTKSQKKKRMLAAWKDFN